MNTFTKDHPFEFEGVKVWEVDSRYYPLRIDDEPVPTRHLAAYRAYFAAEREAESAEWRWVEDGKVARKGRWTVKPEVEANGTSYVFHDDLTDGDLVTALIFPGKPVDRQAAERGLAPGVVAIWKSFDAWQAAQSHPAEPTTFGYVGTVTDSRRLIWDVMRTGSTGFCWLVEQGGGAFMYGPNPNGLAWSDVLALGTFEPVTR